MDPETFKLEVESGGITETVSEPLTEMKLSDLNNNGDKVSWTYPEKDIDVEIEKKEQYLDLTIKSIEDDESAFSWPCPV